MQECENYGQKESHFSIEKIHQRFKEHGYWD